MTLYLDTEFNGHAGELISLALVSNKSPDEFYGVLPLPDPVHPWVAAHVVPILDRKPDEPAVFRTRLRFFLEKHSGQEIVADWPDDFTHLMKALFKTAEPLLLIPASFLGGGIFCLACDLIARTAFAPTEVSISSVTAVFGAPVVIYMMVR